MSVHLTNSRAAQFTTIPGTQQAREALLREYKKRTGRGLTVLISKRVRRARSQVSNVFHGWDTSARIRRAIERELSRVFGVDDAQVEHTGEPPQGSGGKDSRP